MIVIRPIIATGTRRTSRTQNIALPPLVCVRQKQRGTIKDFQCTVVGYSVLYGASKLEVHTGIYKVNLLLDERLKQALTQFALRPQTNVVIKDRFTNLTISIVYEAIFVPVPARFILRVYLFTCSQRIGARTAHSSWQGQNDSEPFGALQPTLRCLSCQSQKSR